MKKFIALIILLLVSAMVLSSCGGTVVTPDESTTAGRTETTENNDSSDKGETTEVTDTDETNTQSSEVTTEVTDTDESDPPEQTTAKPAPTSDEALKRKLAGDWSMYLAHKESMCSDMYWMIGYLEAFCENPSWETLNKARTALSAMQMTLRALSFPTYNVTASQHAELIAAGCDVSGFWEEMHRLDSVRKEYLSDCDALASELYANTFFTPLFNCTKEYIDYVKTSVDIEMELTACYTDNLICVLNSETLSRDFLAFVHENNPILSEYLPEFSNDIAHIFQRTDSTLDKLEASINQLNLIYGKNRVAADQLEEVLASGNADRFNELRLPLSDDEETLPLPAFLVFNKTSFYLFHSDENADSLHATPGSPINFKSNRCMLILKNVSKTDFVSYINKLDSIGIEPFEIEETDTETSAYYHIGSSSVLIEIAGTEMTILIVGDDVHPIPLYFYK